MRGLPVSFAVLAGCLLGVSVRAGEPPAGHDSLDMLLLSESLRAPDDGAEGGGGGAGSTAGSAAGTAKAGPSGASAQAAQVRDRFLAEAETAKREAGRQRGLAQAAKSRMPSSAGGSGAEQGRRDRQAASNASYDAQRAESAAQSAENMANAMAILAYQPPSTAYTDAVLAKWAAEDAKRQALIQYLARRRFREAYLTRRWTEAIREADGIGIGGLSHYERLLAARASRRAAQEGGLKRAAVADSMRRYLGAPALSFPNSELWIDEHLAWYRAAGKALADAERDKWRTAVKDGLLARLDELYMTVPLSRSSQFAEAVADLSSENGTLRRFVASNLARLRSGAELVREGRGRFVGYNGADIPYLLAGSGHARAGEEAHELELWRDYQDYARFSSDHYRLAYLFELAREREAVLAAKLGARAVEHTIDLLGISEADKATKKQKEEKQETKKKEGMGFEL